MLPNLSELPAPTGTFKDLYLGSLGIRKDRIVHVDERFGPLTEKEWVKRSTDRVETQKSVEFLISGPGFGNTKWDVKRQLDVLAEIYKKDEPVDLGRIQGALDALRHMCSEGFNQNLEAISFLAREKFFPMMLRHAFQQPDNDAWRPVQEAVLELAWQILRNGVDKFDPEHPKLQNALWFQLSDEFQKEYPNMLGIVETILTHAGVPYGVNLVRMRHLANKIAEWRRGTWYRYRPFRNAFAKAMADRYKLKTQFSGKWLLDERLESKSGPTVAGLMANFLKDTKDSYGVMF